MNNKVEATYGGMEVRVVDFENDDCYDNHPSTPLRTVTNTKNRFDE